ncbi:hypothetical protein ACFFWC_29745 [Plantactinospora siamensis]|uniref:PPE family domain-containing protein n=1 Tax=Plantactinospora siamensis TaxID=555372 RepID=A0ABV6NPA8_9ACTN
MANYDYWTAKDKIESGQPYSIESVATTWRNFAEALRSASGHLQGTADKVTEQYGTPYQNFGDRAAPLASWMTNVSGYADTVAEGLSKASTTGSSAQMTMYQEDYSFNQDVERIVGPEDALSAGRANAIQRREAQAAAVLNGEIDKWAGAYDAFQPGAVDPAPTRSGSGLADPGSAGGGGAGGSGGGAHPLASGGTGDNGSTAALAGGIGAAGAASVVTGHGSKVGSGTFPGSSVLGPDSGDFAGWVRDPRTGYLINPATGQEFDPTAGRWIDPVTGKPFGDSERYASRLEGLNTGATPSAGPLGGSGGLAAPLGGGGGAGGTGGGPAGLGGLYGGLQPPSLDPANPAANQLRQQATDSMAAKAYAAQQLALKEASQGGRPYMPPTQAGLAGGPGGGRAGARRSLVTEPESTWTGRARAAVRAAGGTAQQEEPLLSGRAGGRAGRAGGGTVEQEGLLTGRNGGRAGGGAAQQEGLLTGRGGRAGRAGGAGGVAEEPLLNSGSGATAGAGGRSAGTGRGRTGRIPGEPLEEGAGPASGGRAAGSAGQNRNRAYLPPTQAGQGGEREKQRRQRPDWLVEDDVWSANLEAGPPVLGED